MATATPVYINADGLIQRFPAGLTLPSTVMNMMRLYEDAMMEAYNNSTVDWAFRAASADGVLATVLNDLYGFSIPSADGTLSAIAGDVTAMAYIASSAACVQLYIKSTTAFNSLLNSTVAMSALFGSSTVGSVMNQIVVLGGGTTNATLAGLTTTDAIVANTTALASVVGSSLCCQYAVQSSAFMTSIAANTTALGTWAASTTAMTQTYNSAIAANAIVNATASVGTALNTLYVLDGGTTNSTLTGLATWSTVIANTTVMPLIVGSTKCVTMWQLSSTAMATLGASATAVGYVLSNAISRELFFNAQYSVGLALGTYGGITDSTFLSYQKFSYILNDNVDGYNVLFGNSTVMAKVVTSPTAMAVIAGNNSVVTALCSSSTAWPLCLASSIAMIALCGSSVAMGVISVSSSAMSAIMGSATALPIFFSGAYGVGAGLNTYGALNNTTLAACNKFSDVLASSAATAAVSGSSLIMNIVKNNQSVSTPFLLGIYSVGNGLNTLAVADGVQQSTALSQCSTLSLVESNASAMVTVASSVSCMSMVRNYVANWPVAKQAIDNIASGIDSYTVALFHFNNSIADSSLYNNVPVNNGVTFSSANSVLGGYSGYFNGSNTYAYIPNSSLFNLLSNDFTIDFWIYITNIPSSSYYPGIIKKRDAYNSNNSFLIFTNYNTVTSSSIFFAWSTTGNSGSGTLTIGICSINTWYHIAVVRSGSSLYAFLNGTLNSNIAISGALAVTSNNLIIGSGDNCYFQGYIDELRLSNGKARWTTSFTPSTTEYTGYPYESKVLY